MLRQTVAVLPIMDIALPGDKGVPSMGEFYGRSPTYNGYRSPSQWLITALSKTENVAVLPIMDIALPAKERQSLSILEQQSQSYL